MISTDSGRDIKVENEAQTEGERGQRISGLCVFAKMEVSMCLYAESKAQGWETGEEIEVINEVRCQRWWKGSTGSQILSPGTSELYISNWMT